MASSNHTAPESVRRHVLIFNSSGCVGECFRNRSDAEADARRRNENGGFTWRVEQFALFVNSDIKVFGIERFDKMLKSVRFGRFGFSLAVEGAKDELLSCGIGMQYMFDQLGPRKSRRGNTEYGDRFQLVRKKNGLFSLELNLGTAAQKPYGIGKHSESDIDIASILKPIVGKNKLDCEREGIQ